MKIDISQIKNTPVSSKSDIKSKELSTDETNKLKASITSNSFSFKTNKEQDYNVFFRLDKDNIGVKLSESNINRLKDFFSEDNFIDTSKGIILDKDAAGYVAGWFADVAYKRNYLAADKDNNGEITAYEAWNLFDLFNINYEVAQDKNKEYFLKVTNVDETYVSNRIACSIEGKSDLSKALDIVLNWDKDLDGKVTASEYWNTDKDYIDDFGIAYTEDNQPFMRIPGVNILASIEKLKEKELKEIKKLTTLDKLKNQGQDALNNDEKKLLKDFAINLNISEDKLKDLINNDKLGDFISYTKDFINELSEIKLLDIKV